MSEKTVAEIIYGNLVGALQLEPNPAAMQMIAEGVEAAERDAFEAGWTVKPRLESPLSFKQAYEDWKDSREQD